MVFPLLAEDTTPLQSPAVLSSLPLPRGLNHALLNREWPPLKEMPGKTTLVSQDPPIVVSRSMTRLKAKKDPRREAERVDQKEVQFMTKELH